MGLVVSKGGSEMGSEGGEMMMGGRQYFAVPHLFLQESSYSSGILLQFHWNKNGIKQTKVEILIYGGLLVQNFHVLGRRLLHH